MEYLNLKGELARNNISNTQVAKVLGVHINTITNKLNGKSSFSIEEAFKIKSCLLPSCDLYYLFARPECFDNSHECERLIQINSAEKGEEECRI